MKSLLVVLLLMSICRMTSVAQAENQEKLNPLILLDTAFTYNESIIVSPDRFISISTINPKKAMEMYGSPGKHGVVKIETRQDIAFVRLPTILEKFRVDEKFRNLKVCINKVPVIDPDKILADLNQIRSVEVLSSNPPPLSSPDNQVFFLNIVTQAGM